MKKKLLGTSDPSFVPLAQRPSVNLSQIDKFLISSETQSKNYVLKLQKTLTSKALLLWEALDRTPLPNKNYFKTFDISPLLYFSFFLLQIKTKSMPKFEAVAILAKKCSQGEVKSENIEKDTMVQLEEDSCCTCRYQSCCYISQNYIKQKRFKKIAWI